MFLFFLSSRRRHTRWPRDWSSDVCSSDLVWQTRVQVAFAGAEVNYQMMEEILTQPFFFWFYLISIIRSEERRVGKECRSWRDQYCCKKNKRQGGEERVNQ